MEMEEIKITLNELSKQPITKVSIQELLLEKNLEDLKQENEYWRQRAKVHWYTEGDQNTNFFHISVLNKRRGNNIN